MVLTSAVRPVCQWSPGQSHLSICPLSTPPSISPSLPPSLPPHHASASPSTPSLPLSAYPATSHLWDSGRFWLSVATCCCFLSALLRFFGLEFLFMSKEVRFFLEYGLQALAKLYWEQTFYEQLLGILGADKTFEKCTIKGLIPSLSDLRRLHHQIPQGSVSSDAMEHGQMILKWFLQLFLFPLFIDVQKKQKSIKMVHFLLRFYK